MQSKSTVSYFYGSIAVTLVCMALGYHFGGLPGLFATGMLGMLETSLSVDNAVVNAKYLDKMSMFWRKMFLTVGMLIAVFGMRVFFPLVIVAATTDYSIAGALNLAFDDPTAYSAALTAAHYMIAGFGGAFLMLVFLHFFLDEEKDTHWLPWIERPLAGLAKIGSIQIVLTIFGLYLTTLYLPSAAAIQFFMAGIVGIVTYAIVGSLEPIIEYFTGSEDAAAVAGTTGTVAKAGFGTFLYLEVLDASFSFDGVIGAFAVTSNIVVIALGLAIGAMFVRSMTLMLVDKGTLAEFKYLEHGAFWAIGALATIMFISTFHHLSEMVSGTVGAAFIVLAIWSSVRLNRKEAVETGEQGSGTNSAGPGGKLHDEDSIQAIQ